MYSLLTQLPTSKAEPEGSEEEEEEEEVVEEEKVKELATKTPANVPLPDGETVMQISCGTFHTGQFVV